MSTDGDRSRLLNRTDAAPSIEDSHIVLIGLPGSGKTTVGRLVAARMHREFLDLDDAIERRAGLTVAQIFAERGEDAFRALEVEVTREVVGVSGMVLAPGGGWIANAAASRLLVERGATLVWLQVSPEVAVARLAADPRVRPLIARGDPLANMGALAHARAKYHVRAQFAIDTEHLSPDEVADRIAALAPGGRGV